MTHKLTVNVVLPPAVRHVQVLLTAEQPKVDAALRFRRVVPPRPRLDPVVGGEGGHQQAHDQAAAEERGKHDPARLQTHLGDWRD